MIIVARHLVEYTDHRIVIILQGLRGRSPPRPGSHGTVGAITRDGASSINVVAISRSSRCDGYPVNVLLYFRDYQKCLLSEERFGSYSSKMLRVVRWRNPLGKTRHHKVSLVRIRLNLGEHSTH